MNLNKYFERLQRLHRLIRKRGTGAPSELAKKLDLSERAVFEYIRVMKEMGGPIAFCLVRNTYYYEKDVQFSIGFRKLSDDGIEDTDGDSLDIF